MRVSSVKEKVPGKTDEELPADALVSVNVRNEFYHGDEQAAKTLGA